MSKKVIVEWDNVLGHGLSNNNMTITNLSGTDLTPFLIQKLINNHLKSMKTKTPTKKPVKKQQSLKIYRVFCDYYSDTRMGGSNPSYYVGKSVTSLEDCKKEIKQYFKKQGREIKDFDIKNSNWTHDFSPEIMSIHTETVKF